MTDDSRSRRLIVALALVPASELLDPIPRGDLSELRGAHDVFLVAAHLDATATQPRQR